MIETQVRKRGVAFSACLALSLFACLPFMISGRLLFAVYDALCRGGASNPAVIAVFWWIGCMVASLVFWVKAHYHWLRAKGHSGWPCILASLPPFIFASHHLGIAGLLVPPVVLFFLSDRGPGTSEGEEQAPLLRCPHCGAGYRPGDYSPDAERMLCPACKGGLPRACEKTGFN